MKSQNNDTELTFEQRQVKIQAVLDIIARKWREWDARPFATIIPFKKSKGKNK